MNDEQSFLDRADVDRNSSFAKIFLDRLARSRIASSGRPEKSGLCSSVSNSSRFSPAT